MKRIVAILFLFTFITSCDNSDDASAVSPIKGDVTMGVWIGGNVTPQVSIYYPNWKNNVDVNGFVAPDSCQYFRQSTTPCTTAEPISKITLAGSLTGVELKKTDANLFQSFITAGLQATTGPSQTGAERVRNGPAALGTTMAYQKAVVFPDPDDSNADAIWLIGGVSGTFNHSISYSKDGLTWTDVVVPTADFTNRHGHQVVTMVDPENNKNSIWVIAGKDQYSTMNDIWKSSDGITWSQVIPTTDVFGPRYGHSVTVFPDPNNKSKPTLWVVGGYNGTSLQTDVWKSADGESWTKVTTAGAQIDNAYYSELVVNNDKSGKPAMFLVGGNIEDVVRKSNDGITWTSVATGERFSAREAHSCFVLNGKIWLIGGFSNYFQKDIWTSSDGETWTQITNDTGASITARAFHSAVVMKDKSNNNSDTMWIMGGTGSKVENATENDCWKSTDGKIFRKGIRFSFSFDQ
ncbi:MAG: sialidase family protein [Bacteroidota bacterium]